MVTVGRREFFADAGYRVFGVDEDARSVEKARAYIHDRQASADFDTAGRQSLAPAPYGLERDLQLTMDVLLYSGSPGA